MWAGWISRLKVRLVFRYNVLVSELLRERPLCFFFLGSVECIDMRATLARQWATDTYVTENACAVSSVRSTPDS